MSNSKSANSNRQIGIGFLGAGTVGGGALGVLLNKSERLSKAVGADLVVKKVLVRDPNKKRAVDLPREVLTTDPDDVLNNPEIDLVVELIGGEDPAYSYMATALESGKHLVTANKEVIAKHGAELLRLAARRGVNLFYEASVGGGIPIIHVLRHELVANEMVAIQAIINGTTNYILSEMAAGRSYADALAQAQRLGYAEADPKNDVEGIDARYKLAILSTLAFHSEVRPTDLTHVGITRLDPKDFRYAAEMGYVVKLIAWAKLRDGMIEGAVYPTMVPERHHLAAVKGSFNAIVLDGDQIDQMMLYGRGAGSEPTASAVVADVCRVALDVARGVTDRVNIEERSRPIRPFADLAARFYFRMEVVDRPGVLAQITQVLGAHEISIASVIQKEADPETGAAELVIMTHSATEGQVEKALAAIRRFDVVHSIPAFIRVGG